MRIAAVDHRVIRGNLRAIQQAAGVDHVIAAVKADAYGHGLVEVSRTLVAAGVDALGVFDLDEALQLRRAGISAPVLAWMLDDWNALGDAVEAGITFGVSHVEQLHSVSNAAAEAGGVARVHLEFDTGLSRGGASESEWMSLLEATRDAQAAGAVVLDGLFTHLANTTREDNQHQAERFQDVIDLANGMGLYPALVHIAASEAALGSDSFPANAIRVGIALYGLEPGGSVSLRDTLGSTPALTLTSNVVDIRQVDTGTAASYGSIWRAHRPSRLALVPIGYADGLPRAASGKAWVSINGQRFPVAGRIAMDQILVDVTDGQEGSDGWVQVGDSVVVWGDPGAGHPTADDWAEWAGTIGYELVTKIGKRVRFHHVDVV